MLHLSSNLSSVSNALVDQLVESALSKGVHVSVRIRPSVPEFFNLGLVKWLSLLSVEQQLGDHYPHPGPGLGCFQQPKNFIGENKYILLVLGKQQQTSNNLTFAQTKRRFPAFALW